MTVIESHDGTVRIPGRDILRLHDPRAGCGEDGFRINGIPLRLSVWTREQWAVVPEAARPNAVPLDNGCYYLITEAAVGP